MTGNVSPQNRLTDIARRLKNSEAVPGVTVREFLGWFFGAQRRGRGIVTYIRDELHKASLQTVPDFESAYLDAEMKFGLTTNEVRTRDSIQVGTGEIATRTDHVEVKVLATTFEDPTYRISKLGAANKRIVSVNQDSSLVEATTLMMAYDFSQLPVMTSDRDVKGAVSWKSIGRRVALGQTPKSAREVMDPHAEISSDASLFNAIPIIVEHEFVLVRGVHQRIVGIITTSDLSVQFHQLSEPFLLLGEIENHIRRIIGSKFGQDELAGARNPTDATRPVERASDLTFGEYKRLLEEPSRWAKLALQLDRAVFIEQLEKVRAIRNDVMHFDPDGIEDEALEVLRDFAKFLRTLQTVGAT